MRSLDTVSQDYTCHLGNSPATPKADRKGREADINTA